MFFSLFFVGATLWMACNPITRENFGEQMWNTYCSFVHEKCCKEKTLADATKQLFGESMDECLKKYGETIDFGGLFKINFKETYDKIANSEDVDFKTENAAKCVESFANQSCENTSAPTNIVSGCDDVIIGKRPQAKIVPKALSVCLASAASTKSAPSSPPQAKRAALKPPVTTRLTVTCKTKSARHAKKMARIAHSVNVLIT